VKVIWEIIFVDKVFAGTPAEPGADFSQGGLLYLGDPAAMAVAGQRNLFLSEYLAGLLKDGKDSKAQIDRRPAGGRLVLRHGFTATNVIA
jgi:hypothetical protein